MLLKKPYFGRGTFVLEILTSLTNMLASVRLPCRCSDPLVLSVV